MAQQEPINLLFVSAPDRQSPINDNLELYKRAAQRNDILAYHAPISSASPSGCFGVSKINSSLTFEEFLALDSPSESACYHDFDLVLSRVADPLPRDYFANQALFESAVGFVTRPSTAQYAWGKQFMETTVASFVANHIFTSDPKAALQFLGEFKSIVAKHPESSGGKGIWKVTLDGSSCLVEKGVEPPKIFIDPIRFFEELFNQASKPFQLVRFLKNIAAGDKRVLVVDGEVYGAYIRKGSGWIHNISSGGQRVRTTVSQRELDTINATASLYHDLGLYILGYDFLMDDDQSWILSEINFANCSGFLGIEELYGDNTFDRFFEWLTQSFESGKFSHQKSKS